MDKSLAMGYLLIVGNTIGMSICLMMLFVILSHKFLQLNPYYKMLLSLTISDIMSILFSTSFSVPCIFANSNIFPNWFGQFGAAVSNMAYRVMIHNVFFTAWNRFARVCYPNSKYFSFLRHENCLVAMAWLLGILNTTTTVFVFNCRQIFSLEYLKYTITCESQHFYLYANSLNAVIFTFILFPYGFITYKVFKVKNQVASSLMHSTPQNVELRLSIQSILIGVILIFNNVTFQIVSNFQTGYTVVMFNHISAIIVSTHSTILSFVFNRKLREKLVLVFKT